MTTVYSIKHTLSIEIIDKQRTEFIVIWLVRRRVSSLNGGNSVVERHEKFIYSIE